ncbi:hypothetical protein T484DRAFT_1862442 [Baffinella frigidus]|nr:hypothetical protein T484DRAFT_1862442 [Cryptophyta sp. CCMP2293]
MFEKNPTKNEVFDYRLRQEGVPFLLPFMTKRVLKVNKEDFITLITKRAMPMADLATPQAKYKVAAFEHRVMPMADLVTPQAKGFTITKRAMPMADLVTPQAKKNRGVCQTLR